MPTSADWLRLAAKHHCLVCGWYPIEGMARYLEIHDLEAVCLRCNEKLPSEVQDDGTCYKHGMAVNLGCTDCISEAIEHVNANANIIFFIRGTIKWSNQIQ